jgi:hypothetical protein
MRYISTIFQVGGNPDVLMNIGVFSTNKTWKRTTPMDFQPVLPIGLARKGDNK